MKFSEELRVKARSLAYGTGVLFNATALNHMADELDKMEALIDSAKNAAPAGPPTGGDIFDEVTPKHSFDDLVLQPYVMDRLNELQDDIQFASALRLEGLQARSKLLIHGPSGCGKTSIAHALAIKNKMPLYRASLGEMISMYIGESEKKVTKLFRFIGENRCVMLLDECDSFLMRRSGSDTAGSMVNNRLVNCFLVELEAVQPAGLVVAATNMHALLDAAVLRRFDLTVEMMRAGDQALRKIAEKTLRPGFDIDIDRLIEDSSTPALIVQRVKDLMRNAVIDREKAKLGQLQTEAIELHQPKGAVV